MKYSALAAFVGSELFITGLAAIYSLGGVFGYGPSTPGMGVAILLLGQVIGALPAIILGAILGGLAGFLFAQYPGAVGKLGGILWGVLYSLGAYLLLAGLLTLFFGRYFKGYEFFSLLFSYIVSPNRPNSDFFLSYLGVFVLYLCAGAWVGAKLEKLVSYDNRSH